MRNHRRGHSVNLIGDILNFIIGLIIFVIVGAIVIWILYAVLSNGAHYGAVLGDMVSGAIEFFKSFFTHAVK